MTIENMMVKQGDRLALVDEIRVICCVLTNLSEPVVPGEQCKNCFCYTVFHVLRQFNTFDYTLS